MYKYIAAIVFCVSPIVLFVISQLFPTLGLQDPTTDPGRDKLEAACTGGACAAGNVFVGCPCCNQHRQSAVRPG